MNEVKKYSSSSTLTLTSTSSLTLTLSFSSTFIPQRLNNLIQRFMHLIDLDTFLFN